jgi:nucleoid DNA-binding protein
MNKKEVAESIYRKLQIKRFEAYGFIDLFIETIGEQLMKNEKVVISNFGTFKVVKREKKRVINPNDKKEMIIPVKNIVKFYPSKSFKEALEEN